MDFLLFVICLISFVLELLFTALVIGNTSFEDGACGAVKDTIMKGFNLYKDKNFLGIILSTIICILGIPALAISSFLAILEILINIGINVWELGNKKERG